MPELYDSNSLADLLPGSWRVGATNFALWFAEDRSLPQFHYERISSDPFVVSDLVTYRTAAGSEKSVSGMSRWDGAHFVRRGRGMHRLIRSNWTVLGHTPDAQIVAIGFSKSIATKAGVAVMIRDDVQAGEFRASVAHASEALGLSNVEFASLTWLDLDPDLDLDEE